MNGYIVFITGFADIPIATKAMKQGAVDFLEKPVNSQQLLEAINQCIQKHETLKSKDDKISRTLNAIKQLTIREKEVMDLMIEGLPTKAIANKLGISINTVECHRAKVMKKMKVKSLAYLVRLIIDTF